MYAVYCCYSVRDSGSWKPSSSVLAGSYRQAEGGRLEMPVEPNMLQYDYSYQYCIVYLNSATIGDLKCSHHTKKESDDFVR